VRAAEIRPLRRRTAAVLVATCLTAAVFLLFVNLPLVAAFAAFAVVWLERWILAWRRLDQDIAHIREVEERRASAILVAAASGTPSGATSGCTGSEWVGAWAAAPSNAGLWHRPHQYPPGHGQPVDPEPEADRLRHPTSTGPCETRRNPAD